MLSVEVRVHYDSIVRDTYMRLPFPLDPAGCTLYALVPLSWSLLLSACLVCFSASVFFSFPTTRSTCLVTRRFVFIFGVFCFAETVHEESWGGKQYCNAGADMRPAVVCCCIAHCIALHYVALGCTFSQSDIFQIRRGFYDASFGTHHYSSSSSLAHLHFFCFYKSRRGSSLCETRVQGQVDLLESSIRAWYLIGFIPRPSFVMCCYRSLSSSSHDT